MKLHVTCLFFSSYISALIVIGKSKGKFETFIDVLTSLKHSFGVALNTTSLKFLAHDDIGVIYVLRNGRTFVNGNMELKKKKNMILPSEEQRCRRKPIFGACIFCGAFIFELQ